MIPAVSLCSIYGASGSYKSFLAGSWACHVATGRQWGGRRVAHGAVLYVVGEGGIADSVISARAARPGGNRRKTTGTQGNQPPAGGDDPYGDDISF
ncbi:AAA family ATPase [Escherichia coli]|nr:AAA family ATPase [Escherichia coli]